MRYASDLSRTGPAGQVPAFFYCKQLEVGFVSDETSGKRLEDSLVYYRNALQKQIDDRRPARPAAAVPFFILLPPDDVPPPEPELDLGLELPPPPPEAATVDLPQESGSVTFTVAGGRITLDSVAAADGWNVREEERDGGSFEVDLVDAERQLKVEFSSEFDDGSLELDYETRSGPGYESGDDDVDEDDD